MNIKRNIIFAPESRKKDGIPVTKNVPIRMRVIFASQRIEFTTGYRIDVEKWDTDKQRVRNGCTNKLKQSASEINAELLRQYTEIQNVFKEFEVQDVIPTPAQIKEAFNLKTKGEKKENHEEKQKVELDFMKVFNEFVAECSKQNDWSSSTLKKFATVKKHIYTFDPNTTFDSWTEKHFNDYIEFLRTEKNMRNTSIAKQIKFVKWFLRWSNRKGYHQNMAYDKFTPKMKSAPKKVIFLTQNEINKLRTCPIPPTKKYLERVRDVLLFCCFTGLRHSDVYNLKRSDVKNGHIEVITINKEADKWLVIDPNGKELFEASSNGYQQYSYTFFENGYCLIENFLLNEKGEKAQRFPSNIYSISPFIDNVALFQDSKTGLWGQLNIEGESIGEPKYSRALGIIDDWIYVADTIANLRDEWDNQYMNVYAINSKGEIKNKIENVSCFYPLSQYAIMAENEKYYFADKKGNPIDNNSYYKISVPPFTDAPSYSPFWSSLIAPHSMSDYDAWGVATDYIDEKKTLASIFDKLTSDGIDSLKIGQTISRIMDLYNIKQMPTKGMVDLHNRDWGINQVFATYSVGILHECKCAIVIKVKINVSASPIGDNPKKLFDAIPQYLTETLGLKREDETLYRSEDACYDIVYYEGEDSFFLMSKAITEK